MASKAQKALQVAKTFTHKYLNNIGAIDRERKAANFKRVKFPTETFVMIQPGVPVPKDVVVFRVPLHYNKLQIKNYIEELYRVPVKKVNTAIYLGKRRLNKLGFYYKRSDYKKAYVRLTEDFAHPGYKVHLEAINTQQGN